MPYRKKNPYSPSALRIPDHTDIWRVIPPDPDKPMFALSFRQDWWNLIFYGEDDKTKYKNLYTKDPEAARKIRDDLYRRAKLLGRGSESAIEAHARKILWEIEKRRIPGKGIKYNVQFANRSGSFETREAAIAFLKGICLDVVGKKDGFKKKEGN